MPTLSSIAPWIDDRLNPIVVKELRQAVQSRFVSALLLLFLLAMLVVLGVAAVTGEDMVNRFGAGRDLFGVLHGFLLVALVLFVPAYSGVRMAAERSTTNVDLLFITTLRPRSVVTGKFCAGLTLALMIYSACVPFIAITYLFRGIELLSIFVVLAFDMLLTILAIAAAILVASIRVGLLLRIILSLALLGGLISAISTGTVAVVGMMSFGVAARLDSWDFWGPALGVCIGFLLATGGLLFGAAALLAPPSANRAIAVRLYGGATWLVSGIISALIAANTGGTVMEGWVMLMVAGICGWMFISISERDSWGPRIRRDIPASIPRRAVRFLLTSGSAGGMAWCVLLLLLTMGVAAAYPLLLPDPGRRALDTSNRLFWPLTAMGLYIYCYCLTAGLLRRWLPTTGTGVIAAVLIGIGSIVPPLSGFFAHSSNSLTGWWLLGNPFAALGYPEDRRFCSATLEFAAVWAVIITLACIPWLARQISAFKPLPRPVAPPVAGAVPVAVSGGQTA
jgi:hypothetical protein